MIDHVSITVSDLERAGAFYDAIMAALGHARVNASAQRIGYGRRRSAAEPNGPSYISIVKGAAVAADRRHWAFATVDCAAVAAFHGAALKAARTTSPLSSGIPTATALRRSATGRVRASSIRHRPVWRR